MDNRCKNSGHEVKLLASAGMWFGFYCSRCGKRM